MPVHHLLEQILDEYIVAAGLQSGQPLFQSVNSAGTAVTGRALNRYNAWAAIRKRAKAAGFLTPVGCHTWRATGITIYLENDGRLEHAQQMAGHESPRTTKLYDRTKDEITLKRGGANTAVTFVPKLRPPTRNPLLHPPLAHCYGQEFLPSLGNVRYRCLHGRYQHADDSEGPAALARTADTARLRRADSSGIGAREPVWAVRP